ncbi:MAG: phosphoribosyltransferase [Candidatus Micrarchaeota archaeon]
MQFYKPSWKKITELCSDVADRVVESNFSPDLLIGISRGGLVPVRLLSDYLGVKNVAIIRIEFYTKVGETKTNPEITQPLSVDVSGKKVLIVDDIADSGNSLLTAKNYLKEKGASEIKTATLHYKSSSLIKPDYYSEGTTAWVVYPWEKEETEREIRE